MADYNAGQAYLTILPDLSSFGEKVRAELAKENLSATARINPEVETAEIDAKIAEIESKISEIRGDAHIGADDAEANAKIDLLKAKLDELYAKRAQVTVRAETAEADAELAATKAEADNLDGKTVNIKTDTGSSASDINALMAAGIALGPAIIPVAAAVAAALAAIGTGAVIGGAGIGAIILGFHGVSSALKDMDTTQKDTGKTAAQVAAQQISSANSIANAQDGVRNAIRSVDDAQRTAALNNRQATEQVANAQRSLQDAYISSSQSIQSAINSEQNAERQLASAQQQEQLAQESLTSARLAAQRQIESLTLAVEDGALAERQAQLNIQQAKQQLDQTLANPQASQLQREQAQLTYDQAVQQLKDIQVRNQQNAQDKASADAKGVEGSQQVQAAQRGVQQATQGVTDAQRNLVTAEAGVTEARRKGAGQIAAAQQNLTDAQAHQAEVARAGAEAIQKAQEGVVTAQRALAGALAQQAAQQSETSSSTNKLAEDMAKLSPAGQQFAHFVHDDLLPKFKELQGVAQQGLLPGVEQGLKNAMPIFPQVKGLIGDLSLEFGSLATRAGAALTNPFWTNWILFIRREAVPSTEIFGQTLGNLATGGAALLQAFAPVWDQMGRGVLDWSQKFSAAAQNLQSNPAFQEFMDYVKTNGPIVAHTFGDLITALVHVGESLGPVGHITLEVVDGFLKLINSMPTTELTILTSVLSVGLTAWQAWKIVQTVTGWVGDFKKGLTDTSLTVGTWTEKMTGSAAAGEKTMSAVKGIGSALPFLGAAFVAADAAQGAFAIDQDKVVQALLQGGEAARQAADSFNQQSLFAKILTGSIVGIGPTMATATQAMKDQLAAMDPLTRAQTLAKQAQNDYLDAVNRWGAESPQAVDAQRRYAQATTDAAQQQQILKDGLDRTTDSLKKQQDQLLSASDAEIRWRDALQTVTDGIQQNGATLDLNTAAGRRNQQNVNDLIRAMISEEDTMKNNGATVDQLTAQHQIFHDQLVNVYTQMGYTQQQALNLANQYIAIKDIGTIATDFLANTGAAIVAVNDMKNQINGALSQITQEQIMVTFKADTGNILNSATGGAVIGPGTGTSDSVGPVMLSHGEHVLTAAEVTAMGGHDAVFSMRKQAVKSMAIGGPVLWQDTSTWNAGGIPDVATANRLIVEHIAQKMRQQEVAPSSSPGVAHWRPISLQALAIAGQDASNLGRLEMQMGTESGGSPTAINRWDINWQKGTPSVGLMQVIGPTYARYHHPQYSSPPFEYGVSEDPLSNILSAIRYTLAAYGSLAAGWQGHGYDSGGWLPPGISLAYNGTGQHERVLTGQQYGALTSAASTGEIRPINISVYPRAEHSEADIADMVSRRLEFAMRANI